MIIDLVSFITTLLIPLLLSLKAIQLFSNVHYSTPSGNTNYDSVLIKLLVPWLRYWLCYAVLEYLVNLYFLKQVISLIPFNKFLIIAIKVWFYLPNFQGSKLVVNGIMLYKSKFIHTRDNNETVEVDYVDLFDLQMANFSNKLENYIMIHLPNSIELIEIHKSLLNNYQGSYLNYLLSYFADDDILNTETFITNLEKFIFKPTRNILDRARIRQGNSTTIMVSSILDDNTPEYSNFDAPPPYTSAGNSDSRNSSCVQLPTGGLRTHYGRSTSMPQLCGVSSSSSPGSLFSKKWKRGNRNNNNNNNNR